MLLKRGLFDGELAKEKWEALIRKATLGGTYNKVLFTSKALAKKYNEYLLVRSIVIVLSFGYNKEMVATLEKMGYHVDRRNYAQSLASILVKNENNITQVNVLRSEMPVSKKVDANFHSMITSLSVAVGFKVDAEILLAEYIEFVKMLKQKEK
jgi:hypothetical protein